MSYGKNIIENLMYGEFNEAVWRTGAIQAEMENFEDFWVILTSLLDREVKGTVKSIEEGANQTSELEGKIRAPINPNVIDAIESWLNTNPVKTDQEIETDRIIDAIERRQAAERTEEISRLQDEPELSGKIRIAFKDTAYLYFFINKGMIDQWLWGRQVFRCDVMLQNPWYQPYMEADICNRPIDRPLNPEDQAEQDIEEERERPDDIEEDISDFNNLMTFWKDVEKVTKKGSKTRTYSEGRRFRDRIAGNAKQKSNRYLNFITMLKFSGKRAKLVKGWYKDQYRFWAEIGVGKKWFILDFDSKFQLKEHLKLKTQKRIRSKYLKTAELNLI